MNCSHCLCVTHSLVSCSIQIILFKVSRIYGSCATNGWTIPEGRFITLWRSCGFFTQPAFQVKVSGPCIGLKGWLMAFPQELLDSWTMPSRLCGCLTFGSFLVPGFPLSWGLWGPFKIGGLGLGGLWGRTLWGPFQLFVPHSAAL